MRGVGQGHKRLADGAFLDPPGHATAVSHDPYAAPRTNSGGGLSLFGILNELQRVLVTYLGYRHYC